MEGVLLGVQEVHEEERVEQRGLDGVGVPRKKSELFAQGGDVVVDEDDLEDVFVGAALVCIRDLLLRSLVKSVVLMCERLEGQSA